MSLHEPTAALAFTLGLWTAVQPCPMTANVAAVVWLGRRAESVRGGVLAALLFVAGQTIAYVSLSWLVLGGIAASWRLSAFLQQHVNEFLGPAWIIAGMVLLGLIEFRLPRFPSPLPPGEGQGVRADSCATRGVPKISSWSALPLGIVLAMAFCPVTAVLFFVNLVTIARSGSSHVVYPLVYAIGASLPVAGLALLLGTGSRWLGTAFDSAQRMHWWLNRAAGVVLLAVGVYYALRFDFAVLPS